MADAGGAERLGVRLLGEVEECGLGELLTSLRTLILQPEQSKTFNIPELDALLPTPQPAPPIQIQQQHHPRSDDDTWDPNPQPPRIEPYQVISGKKKGPHILELISPPHTHHPSPSGKTSLLHLIITHAILPPTLSSVHLSGLNASVILLDPLQHFSIPFLATTALTHIASCFTSSGRDATAPTVQKDITQCVKNALTHVHIFQPASWDGLLCTLRQLESYLFDGTRHASRHRAVHSIILDDVDAFLPAVRERVPVAWGGNAVSAASALLTRELEKLASGFSCAVVTAGRSSAPGGFRPGMPLSWPGNMQLTRLAVRRVEVLKFAPGISVQEAEVERSQRWEVVQRGRFEAWKVGQGRDGEGFVFRVGRGVTIEADER